jgi:hypothetical protein
MRGTQWCSPFLHLTKLVLEPAWPVSAGSTPRKVVFFVRAPNEMIQICSLTVSTIEIYWWSPLCTLAIYSVNICPYFQVRLCEPENIKAPNCNDVQLIGYSVSKGDVIHQPYRSKDDMSILAIAWASLRLLLIDDGLATSFVK